MHLLNIKEMAAILAISPTKMYAMARGLEVPFMLIGSQYRFVESEVIGALQNATRVRLENRARPEEESEEPALDEPRIPTAAELLGQEPALDRRE